MQCQRPVIIILLLSYFWFLLVLSLSANPHNASVLGYSLNKPFSFCPCPVVFDRNGLKYDYRYIFTFVWTLRLSTKLVSRISFYL